MFILVMPSLKQISMFLSKKDRESREGGGPKILYLWYKF